MDYIGLGCCALAFVLYLNTLDAGFVYDDRRAILENPDVIGTTPWKRIIFNDFWGTPLTDSGSHGSYRPLCVLSYKINYLFGGHHAIGYHFVNILLHSLATGLVVKLAKQLLPPLWGPAVAGALFASHPIHTEAVAGIVGRADLAACNFYLLAFLAYSKHVTWRETNCCQLKSWCALTGTILLSIAAVFCKETAITALLICAIYDIIKALSGYHDKHRIRSLTILGLALATLLQLRLSLPGPSIEFSTADNPIAKSPSIFIRFLTFLYLPVFNFKLLIYPFTLSFDWGMDALPRLTTIFDARNIFSIVFYGSFGYAIYRNVYILKTRLPIIIERRRRARVIKKRVQQQQQQQQQQQHHQQNHQLHQQNHHHHHHHPPNHHHQDEQTNHQIQLLDCICLICKQGLNLINHTNNSNRLTINNNNNNNFPSLSRINCECSTIGRNPSPTNLSALSFWKNIENYKSKLIDVNNNNQLGDASSESSISSVSSVSSNSSTSSLSSVSSLSVTSVKSTVSVPQPPTAVAILLSIALLALPFLPAANLFFYVGFVVAERILYLPSVGYCLLIGLGVGKLMDSHKGPMRNPRVKFTVKTLVIIMLMVYSAKTIHRNIDWHDEESLYRSAIRINPPKALGNLGSVLSSQGRYAEAKEALIMALQHRPNMADVHYNLGILYQNHQKYDDAVECFRKAIHFRPSLALAYLNLGTSLIALGKCNEAASILREGSKLDGTGLRDRTAHNNARISTLLQLGSLYTDQGKLQRALAVYREALHNLPENYPPQTIYHRLGDTLARLHQWTEAEHFHQAALELQPNHIATYVSYGTMLARNSSRTSEAEQWFKRAVKLAPSDSSVRHHYAEFLTSLARHIEACEQRIKAAELSPNDYSLVVAAATALRLIDRKVEAEKWYRLAVSLRPDDARSHTNLGAILHLLGRPTQAADSYKEALKLQPGDPTTLANLAKLDVSEFE